MNRQKWALFDLLRRSECPIWSMDPDRLLEMADYLIRCGVTIPDPEEKNGGKENDGIPAYP